MRSAPSRRRSSGDSPAPRNSECRSSLRAARTTVSLPPDSCRPDDLRGRQKRRYRVRTTDRAHSHPIAPNWLAALPVPTKPNQVVVGGTDLAYVPTDEGRLHVAGVLDRCTRCLVGWAMDSTLETTVPLAALMMAARLHPDRILDRREGVARPVTEWRASRA